MGLKDQVIGLFGKKRGDVAVEADRARQQSVRGKGFSVSADDQQATRSRMEAELQGQRDRRTPVSPPDA